MRRTEHEFWKSSYRKISYAIEQYEKEMVAVNDIGMDKDVPLINSMKEIEGW